MKKVLAIVLVMMMLLSCAAMAEGKLGFLPPAMTSPSMPAASSARPPLPRRLAMN